MSNEEDSTVHELVDEPVQEIMEGSIPETSDYVLLESKQPNSEGKIEGPFVREPTEILSLLQQIVQDFETKFKYDATKQEQIDKLHKENMEYRSGILEQLKRSLILAVIAQIDAAEKQIAFFGTQEFSEENYRKLLGFYQDTTDDFQNTLRQQFDTTVFRCEPDTPFDPVRQRALKTISAEEPEKHKLVKRSLRPGYELDGSILRPEMVEVYVYLFEKK